jgi:hypothetical protein
MRGAERRVSRISDCFESQAGGAAVEFVRLLGDVEASAEPGKKRLLQGQFAAESINGGDAELGRQIEQLPAEGVGPSKGAKSERVWAHACGARRGPGCAFPRRQRW